MYFLTTRNKITWEWGVIRTTGEAGLSLVKSKHSNQKYFIETKNKTKYRYTVVSFKQLKVNDIEYGTIKSW